MRSTPPLQRTIRNACIAAFGAILVAIAYFNSHDREVLIVNDIVLKEVKCGQRMAFVTLVKNMASSKCRIHQVYTCCGTRITTYPREIAANTRSEIKGEFTVPSVPGPFEKKIVIFSELEGLRQRPFSIKGFAVVE